MEENYVEWLVKRKDPIYALPVKIVMAAVFALSVLMALGSVLGVVLMTVVGAAGYFIFLSLSVEFEYLFAEGGLRIDRILGRARRKKVFECEKEEVQIIAPLGAGQLREYENQRIKIMDCTSGRTKKGVYAVICQKGSETIKILLEPNEKMLGAMRRSLPSRFIR